MLRRRQFLQAAALSPTLLAGATAAAEGIPQIAQTGSPIVPVAKANPLAAKITTFTVVSPDLAASIHFYRDVIGFDLLDEGRLAGASTVPGAGEEGRPYATLGVRASSHGGAVRVLQAPAGARPNRPRPGARAFDPGLAVMECLTRDSSESYRRLADAKTPMISSPRYYAFREIQLGRGELDVMSYSPFGPGGEQIFITANVRNDRPDWMLPGLHGNFASAVIVTLDQRPIERFYAKALGLGKVDEMQCFQKNVNELIGAPVDTTFLWGFLGENVSIELEEYLVPEGVVYPTALDATGLAMITISVNDLERCRAMCRDAGISPVGEGALPSPGKPRPSGFTLRGMVGELVEVVAA